MDAQTDTRQRIIDAACQLFHQRSYTLVGVKQICDLAQVQKGSFYHFFPSKQDLVLAVVDAFAQNTRDQVFAQAFDGRLPPMHRIERLVELLFVWNRQEAADAGKVLGCPFGNLALEMSTTDEPLRVHLSHVFAEAETIIATSLSEAVGRGDIAPLDCKATATAMMAYLEGLVLMAKTRNEPEMIHHLGTAIRGIRIENA